MTKKTSKADQSDITIVDGKLILSLPNAQMPVVWQMDLDNAQSSAFTIKEDKKAKTFTFISKSQENTVDEIAVFDDKEAAVDVLMKVSEELRNAHGKIKQATINNNAQIQNHKSSNKTGAILSVALIIVMALIWMLSASKSVNFKNDKAPYAQRSATSPPQSNSGVSMSAEDFLNNR